MVIFSACSLHRKRLDVENPMVSPRKWWFFHIHVMFRVWYQYHMVTLGKTENPIPAHGC